MLVTFKGLIVHQEKNGDYGKLLTIISDTHGRVLMSAKGVNSIKNHNAAACAVFTYAEFVAYYTNGRYTLKSAEPLLFCIKHDGCLERLALASYFVELADTFGRGEQDTKNIMQTCINALHILYKSDRSRRFIKPVYELRMLCLAGYMPDTENCSVCGGGLDQEHIYFCYVGGVFSCLNCPTDPSVKKYLISNGCYNLIRHVISSPENKAYAIKSSENLKKEFFNTCQEFLLAQLEKKPKTLDFYNTTEDNNE